MPLAALAVSHFKSDRATNRRNMEETMRLLASIHIAVIFGVICLASIASAQQSSSEPPQSATPAAWSPSKDIGVFVFGRNGQNADQQLKDESECYGAAKQATGIDPKAPAPAGMTAEQKTAEQEAAAENAGAAKGGRATGAARGAAGGAVIGAIAGSPGTGAAAGAAAGTMRGGMQQRQASAAAKKEASAKVAAEQNALEDRAKLAHAEGLDTFQRAFGSCMDARGYSVK